MKAILLIDMPNDCTECQFCGRGGRNLERYVCCLTREHSEDSHLVGCPLRPLPKEQEHRKGLCSDYILGFEDGWNAYRENLE